MATNIRAAVKGTIRIASHGTKLSLILAVLISGAAFAQSAQQVPPKIPAPAPPPAVPVPPSAVVPPAPCIQPSPMIEWQDYKGPFAQVVAFFDKKLEIRSATPHGAIYKPGSVLCTLTTKEKAQLFVDDFTNPVTFVSAAFNAGIDQAENDDPKFGQEFGGYSKRFGAVIADQADNAFFKDFVYPTVFSQDSRYYRLGRDSTGRRIAHALAHVMIAHHENGAPMFNYTEWLGTITTVALSSTYHGYREHGVGPYAESGAFDIANDAGFDVLREFWPEIVRKLKLPFRTPRQPTT
ncbi:MAG: hypothetical protein KGL02_02770 [Acidobacteriota bacterium]|nr:hypothetical protein [Acidobacteriota bacterium]MDE3169423.1 hypothetical protein [Acidobacteriota bacterium]